MQIGGRRIGSIKKIELTDNNQAELTIVVEEPYAPLHAGTTAVQRMTSLSGVANRYVQLSPGADSNPELPENAVIPTEKTTTIVDLDQFFNTLDPKTSEGLRNTIRGFGTWYAGRGYQGNEVAKYFAPSLSATRKVVEKLAADQPALKALVRDTSQVVTTLGERSATLTDLVTNTNTTMSAIADENAGAGRGARLPAADAAPREHDVREPARDAGRPRRARRRLEADASKNLAPFLADLRPLLVEAKPTIAQLSQLLRQPGADNDFTDLLNSSPELAKQASSTFPASVKALNKGTPILSFFRPYSADLVGWFRDFGQSASNYDANGHYARIGANFNAFSYDQATNLLTSVPPAQRVPGVSGSPTAVARCPGGASQAPADGSAPWRDVSGNLDCDTSVVPPGP